MVLTTGRRARFIYHSNMIENIFYTLDDTIRLCTDFEYSDAERRKSLRKKHPEVINHYMALDLMVARKKPIDWPFIMRAHKVLMKGLLEPKLCGRARPMQVYVGTYTAPAPGEPLAIAMDNYRKDLELLYALKSFGGQEMYGLIYNNHCYFERVHPFRDGNGRMGRLVWLGLLKQWKFEYNEIDIDDRQEYYWSLRQRQERGHQKSTLWYPPRHYKGEEV